MASSRECIRPDTYIFLRLPSELLKLVEINSNTIVDLGKLGCFPANLLLDRPFYHTYELRDGGNGNAWPELAMLDAESVNGAETGEHDTVGIEEDYEVSLTDSAGRGKNNRLTVDDASRQALSQKDIEEMKQGTEGKEIVDRIMANHSALDEKTTFARAKYTLRKTRKYLKRFVALPMEIGLLMEYVAEKEPGRIMEMREESLALMMAWGNAKVTDEITVAHDQHHRRIGGGRCLVVDDTGGLMVAAIAERMGLLHSEYSTPEETEANGNTQFPAPAMRTQEPPDKDQPGASNSKTHRDFTLPARTNTITLLHPAVQPNISLLKYFGYDANNPDPSHPLHKNLKPISWLQLLHPDEDPAYREPEPVAHRVLETWKSGKRGTYWKKRRRWERCRAIVDEAREGGFDALLIASHMDPVSILSHTLPLLRGGGTIVMFSPTPESLIHVTDLYSRDRRTAYIQRLQTEDVHPTTSEQDTASQDFPLDPRLLLAPTIHTTRAREWQVLPGRTHPLMTSRGGAEGYIFTARKAVPVAGNVAARGNFAGKKRKAKDDPTSSLQEPGAL